MRIRIKPLIAGAVLVTLAVSCTGEGDDPSTGWAVIQEEHLTGAQSAQAQRALKARDSMFADLLRELTTAIDRGGPASAISVCKDAAPRIARDVSGKLGVKIGRTSFRLRNPANAPPAWAAGVVEAREGKKVHVALGDGGLGVLLPIRLAAPCVKCHGGDQEIPADVKTALQRDYPQDRATGFRVGDIRGWFWVEVPPPG